MIKPKFINKKYNQDFENNTYIEQIEDIEKSTDKILNAITNRMIISEKNLVNTNDYDQYNKVENNNIKNIYDNTKEINIMQDKTDNNIKNNIKNEVKLYKQTENNIKNEIKSETDNNIKNEVKLDKETENNIKNEEKSDNETLTLQEVYINLVLISKINVNDKLICNSKYINIDNSYFKSLTRWYRGVSRNTNLQFINFILTNAYIFNDKLLLGNNEDDNQNLLRLTNELKNSINGLLNLKQTYTFDKLIESEIDVLIENIRNKVELNFKYFKQVDK